MTQVEMFKAILCGGREDDYLLCGACPEPDAYACASHTNLGWYGHCAICGHGVFLGTHGVHWQHADQITVNVP